MSLTISQHLNDTTRPLMFFSALWFDKIPEGLRPGCRFPQFFDHICFFPAIVIHKECSGNLSIDIAVQ
jgi:hypothetical protein